MRYPRLEFQRNHVKGSVLNVGCQANPAGLSGPSVVHLDMDVWRHPNFVQADAHRLPFRDSSFTTVVLGDVLEHCHDPEAVLKEAYRVTGERVVVTVPAEEPAWEEQGYSHEERAKENARTLEGLPGFVRMHPFDLVRRRSHVRVFTKGELLRLVKGYSHSEVVETSGPPRGFGVLVYKGRQGEARFG